MLPEKSSFELRKPSEATGAPPDDAPVA